MFKYIPNDVLFFIPMYGTIPYINLGIGEFFNLAILVFIIFFIIKTDKQNKTYANGLIYKHCLYLLDGKTGKGKTRLMTNISKDIKKNSDNTIIIANYFNGYADFFYSSFQDFKLLQIDIARLGEFTNFANEEKKEIEKHFPGYFNFVNDELFKKAKKIKGKYNILTLGDEFYAYLHNRNFMSNFGKKDGGDELLLNLHQTRHSNQTLILASQDDDNLDLDLRQLAHNEINVNSRFLDLFFGFNKYKYLTKKEIKEYGLEFKKLNLFPYFFFNYYELNQKINSIIKMYFDIYNFIFCKEIFLKYRFLKIKEKIFIKKIFFKDKILNYNTKFNVKKSINIYKPGTIYDYILNLEKNNKKFDK